MRPFPEQLDHLLLGTSDRDRGIAWFEGQTGVRAAVGGSHPGRGTRNALVALGGRQYLEIIAPDPDQPADNLQMNLRSLREPRLIAWAAVITEIEALGRRVREQDTAGVVTQDGSRSRPDGRVLKWRTLAVKSDLARADVDPIPFFIEWASDSPHPSQDAPAGCQLGAFEFEHPDPKRLESTLLTLGIDAAVREGTDLRLVATVNTPKGRIVLR